MFIGPFHKETYLKKGIGSNLLIREGTLTKEKIKKIDKKWVRDLFFALARLDVSDPVLGDHILGVTWNKSSRDKNKISPNLYMGICIFYKPKKESFSGLKAVAYISFSDLSPTNSARKNVNIILEEIISYWDQEAKINREKAERLRKRASKLTTERLRAGCMVTRLALKKKVYKKKV